MVVPECPQAAAEFPRRQVAGSFSVLRVDLDHQLVDICVLNNSYWRYEYILLTSGGGDL